MKPATRRRRFFCWLGIHFTDEFNTVDGSIRMCKYCPYESDY